MKRSKKKTYASRAQIERTVTVGRPVAVAVGVRRAAAADSGISLVRILGALL